MEGFSKRVFQLPHFDRHLSYHVVITGKLTIAYLFLITSYDLQQSLRLMDLPIIFMLSVSIYLIIKSKPNNTTLCTYC